MGTPYSLTYRADIQGLRAIAILLVVFNHSHVPGFSGGFIGVDVFFVLSGFLISGILIKEYRQSGRIDYFAFIARRLKRLYPALFVMLVTTILLASFILSGYEYSQQAGSAPYAATWISNFYFVFSVNDYFAQLKARDLFLHTWSLAVEEQFYLLWPLTLLALFGLSVSTKGQKDGRSSLLSGLAIVFVASLALSLYWTREYPLYSFYMMPARIWQFTLGAALYVWLDREPVPGRLNAFAGYAVYSGIGLIIGGALFLDQAMSYPGFWALIPSLGAVLVIAGGSFRSGNTQNALLANPGMVWIGDRSYSWYLWHWPILVLGFAWFGQPGYLIITVLILISLMLTALSYRYVELPFWKGSLGNKPPLTVFASTLVVMGLVVGFLPRAPALLSVDVHQPGKPEIRDARNDLPVIYKRGCDTSISSAEIQPCITTKLKTRKTAVLIGDSIGAQWFSAFSAIYTPPEWRLIVLTKSACPIVDQDYFYQKIRKTYLVCRQWRDAALSYLESINPDVVFMGSDNEYEFTKTQWIEGTRRILDHLAPVSGRVVILPGTPWLQIDGPSCIEKQGRAACSFKLPSNSQVSETTGYLASAAGGFGNTTVLSLNDLVCPGEICSARTRAGMPVYRDNKHLTDTFVRTLIPAIQSRLHKIGVVQLFSKEPGEKHG
jgi:peptidoglycan/LPS O-acetylase OafA/YrhL